MKIQYLLLLWAAQSLLSFGLLAQPVGYDVTIDQSIIFSGNESAASITVSSGEVSSTYNGTFSSDGGSGTVSINGPIALANEQIVSIDLSSLPDGLITLDFTLSNASGTGISVLDSVIKDSTSPTATISSSEMSPTNASPIPISIVFNEKVIGLEIADIIVAGGNLLELSTLDSILWTGAVRATNNMVTVDLPANAAQDLAGNGNEAALQFSINHEAIDVNTVELVSPKTAFEILTDSVEVRISNEGLAPTGNVDLSLIVTFKGDTIGVSSGTITSPLAPGDSTNFTFPDRFDFSKKGTYDITYSVTTLNDNDSSNNQSTASITNRVVVAAPISENFENILPANQNPLNTRIDLLTINGLPGWEYTNTAAEGCRMTVGVFNRRRNAERGSEVLFDNPNADCTNNLTLNVDLSRYDTLNVADSVQLYFWVARHGDENDNDDRVFFRTHEDSSFFEIFDITTIGSVSSQFVKGIPLADILRSKKLNFTATSQLRFSQNDNFPYSTDGASFDDVFLGVPVAATSPADTNRILVAENLPIGTIVDTLEIENGSGLFTATSTNIDTFLALDENSLAVTTNSAYDFEKVIADNGGSNMFILNDTFVDVLFGDTVITPIIISIIDQNDAPTFTLGSQPFFEEDFTYDYIIELNDEDGDTVTLTSLLSLPASFALSPVMGSFNTFRLSGNGIALMDTVAISLLADDGKGGMTQQDFDLVPQRTRLTPPLSEDFESAVVTNQGNGILLAIQNDTFFIDGLPGWEYDYGINGRFSIRNDFLSGKHATMDNPGGESFNSFTVNLDLSTFDVNDPADSIELYFSWFDHGDEGDAFDIVGFRTNLSDPFIELYDFATQSNNGRRTDVKGIRIDKILRDNMLNFTGTCQLRFNQNDNFPVNTDGISIDNVFLGRVIAATPPTTLAQLSVNENVPVGTLVGTIAVDNGSGIFSALNPNLGDYFVIDPITLQVRTRAEIDYEKIISDNGGSNVFSFDVILTDDVFGGDVTIPVEISIIDQNDAPVFTSTPIIAINDNQIYTYDITLEDQDGDTVTLSSINPLPSFLTIDSVLGTVNTFRLSGDDLENMGGTYPITLEATDGNGGAVQQTFTITISDLSNPMVTNVTSSTPNGTYTAGDQIIIQVVFNEIVEIVGTPRLELELGPTDQSALYNGEGSGSDTISFAYTIQTGDITPDLEYLSPMALIWSAGEGSMISDTSGNNYISSLPAPGSSNSLGTNKDIVIDAQPNVTLSIDNNTMLESSGAAIIKATLSEVSTTDVITALSARGSASGSGNNIDYNFTTQSITIPAGFIDATVGISTRDDVQPELNETIIIEIDSVQNGKENGDQQDTITIIDDDLPRISFAERAATNSENVSMANVLLNTNGPKSIPVTVDYMVTGTASNNGVDHNLMNGKITFDVESTESRLIIPDILDDDIVELDETVIITLLNPINAVLGGEIVFTYTITNNDTAQVLISDATGFEDCGQISVTATLSKEVQGGFSVDINTNDGTATSSNSDYSTLMGQTLNFSGLAGETQIIQLTPTEDAVIEDDETLSLSQSNLSVQNLAVQIGDLGQVEIQNDDFEPASIFIQGPDLVCPGLTNVDYEFNGINYTDTFTWSFLGQGVTLQPNGSSVGVSFGPTFTSGVLRVEYLDPCENVIENQEYTITASSPEICQLVSCDRQRLFIDNGVLSLSNASGVYKVSDIIESNATVDNMSSLIFKAANGVLLYPPFQVDEGSVFQAEIEDCAISNDVLNRINQKK